MFGKLLLIVLAAGTLATSMLVLRQQRIATAHEMSRVHQRVLEHERNLWQLRTDIAERCSPAVVRSLLAEREEAWRAIPTSGNRSNASLSPAVVVDATGTITPSVVPEPSVEVAALPAEDRQ